MNDETKMPDETAGEDISDLLLRHLTTKKFSRVGINDNPASMPI